VNVKLPENFNREAMRSLISNYITHELLGDPDFKFSNETPLIETKILDSLSLLKLVLFLEKQFGIVIRTEEVHPENFKTVNAICAYLQSKKR
jgi:acyl carrier protein